MEFFVSTYNNDKKIYRCNINNDGFIKIKKSKSMIAYPSYVSRYKHNIAIALKCINNKKAGIMVYNSKFNIKYTLISNISYTHVYYDKSYIIGASYHQGCIIIIDINTKKYINVFYKNSKIHNVGKIGQDYYAVDLNNRKIYFFRIEDFNYIEKYVIKIETEDNPRHLVCRGLNIYILCENSSCILNYKRYNNEYRFEQKISTVKYKNIKNEASAIRIHKNYLFASNRGENSIVMYKIMNDGNLEYLSNFDVNGKNPRDFNILNNGRYLVVGNEDTNELISYKIDYDTNMLSYINKCKIDKPVCIEK